MSALEWKANILEVNQVTEIVFFTVLVPKKRGEDKAIKSNQVDKIGSQQNSNFCIEMSSKSLLVSDYMSDN